VAATVGSLGLISTLKAIESGKDIAIANKEALVMGGALIMKAMERNGTEILPIDSEHSALHQCLRGERVDKVKKLILTASGGPFRNFDKKELKNVSPKQALKHPTWRMGKKITIDSATLMNKGLEIIEAHWLFGIETDHIEVLLHPQSIVHSMVEFLDGSIKCQMGVTDMKVPIQYALTYPDRFRTDLDPLDLTSVGPLEFFAPDFEKFPCLRLAYMALREQGTMPAILNAANEVAVQAFLDEKITFDRIPLTIENAMEQLENIPITGLETLLEVDALARRSAEDYIRRLT
jgi:1-deoxy-D-xylulose-5-phosphate reductoisomerase